MRKLIVAYCLLAGLCDATTGLLLVGAPAFTLGLMGIAETPLDPVYLRFVGTFVGGVGLAYLYPLVMGGGARRMAGRIATVFEVTAIVRLSVALFVAVSVASGALAWPWLSVFFTDLVLALVQLWILRRIFHHEPRDIVV